MRDRFRLAPDRTLERRSLRCLFEQARHDHVRLSALIERRRMAGSKQRREALQQQIEEAAGLLSASKRAAEELSGQTRADIERPILPQ